MVYSSVREHLPSIYEDRVQSPATHAHHTTWHHTRKPSEVLSQWSGDLGPSESTGGKVILCLPLILGLHWFVTMTPTLVTISPHSCLCLLSLSYCDWYYSVYKGLHIYMHVYAHTYTGQRYIGRCLLLCLFLLPFETETPAKSSTHQ